MGQDNKLPKLVTMDREKEKSSTYTREGNVKIGHRQFFLYARLIDCINTSKSQGKLQVSIRSQQRQEMDVSHKLKEKMQLPNL